MEPSYNTLQIIYQIVKAERSPETYLCSPHQLLLRHTEDWDTIEQHLRLLTAEKLIIIKQLDKIAITITSAGIEKAKTFKNNFVSNNFQLKANDEKPKREPEF